MALIRNLITFVGTGLIILITSVGMAACSSGAEQPGSTVESEAVATTVAEATAVVAEESVAEGEMAEGEAMTMTGVMSETGVMTEAGVVTEPEVMTEEAAEVVIAEEMVVKQGEFLIAEENTPASGQAVIMRKSDGSYVVRLQENFSVFEGPDLFVIVPNDPAATASVDIEAGGYMNLGALQAIQGDQEYALPAGVDVATVGHVIIYCRQFTITFAVAALQSR